MNTPRCLSILSVHLVLSILCLSVGFFSPFYFGLYDQCDFVEPERTFDGWSIHRDLSDLFIALLLLGFVFLGIVLGIIDIKHAYGYEKHSVLLLSLFGSFGVYLLLKVLLLDEYNDTAWAQGSAYFFKSLVQVIKLSNPDQKRPVQVIKLSNPLKTAWFKLSSYQIQ